MTVKRRVPAVSAKTTALIIDGAYARIQSRILGGKIDFINLRAELEEMASTEFEECWYFDSQRKDARGDSALASEFHALKYARPRGPQFQVDIFSTKLRNCRCTRCGHGFTQNVQKGVDNGYNIERVVLLSGDGDFYTSLGLVRNALQREVWVVGFPGTVSGDLQQLASQIIWVDDIWGQVKYQGRRGSGRRGWRGLGESHSSRSHHHRSRRSRGHRDSGSHRHRHDRSRSNDAGHEDDDVKSNKEDQEEDVDVADVTIKESSEQQTDPHYDVVKDDMVEDSNINIVQIPSVEEAQKQQPVSPNKSKRMPSRKLNDEEVPTWKSSRVLQPRDVKIEEANVGKPIVVSCSLIVKKREPTRSGRTGGNGLVNYKRFKKGNGYGSRSSTASLFPQQTIVSVVDNAERKALQENLEAMEEQERIAEELFAMGEGRTKTKLF
ncbi:hypothetical protein AM587_10015881 [Phytophthora nicotianae]|uniref:Uncharacterized protein n=1 Tax=Phytophthora nicotianae TaxID=4792 RepID=A0A0W8BVD9_PHYNI|nr:hypothetical protein AM587_10016572 [Phytophthora nicotianae]KUG01174.1 hypothetical protein AM587_10015881 [Phytophthora nicotianae]